MKKIVVGIVHTIDEQGNVAYLLMSSKKDRGEFTGYFYPPGGHVEEGETVEQALVREFQEEFNASIQCLTELAVTPSDFPDRQVHWWSIRLLNNDFHVNPEEVETVGYYSRSQMEEMDIFPATRAFFEQFVWRS